MKEVKLFSKSTSLLLGKENLLKHVVYCHVCVDFPALKQISFKLKICITKLLHILFILFDIVASFAKKIMFLTISLYKSLDVVINIKNIFLALSLFY